jgi:hypothetical protein
MKELEGKEVTLDIPLWVTQSKRSQRSVTFKGLVVGCDPDIGLTVVNIEDKDDILWCISAIQAAKLGKMEEYRHAFKTAVKYLKEGHADVGAKDIPFSAQDMDNLSDLCPFNQ